jgi:hypothetical protein
MGNAVDIDARVAKTYGDHTDSEFRRDTLEYIICYDFSNEDSRGKKMKEQ